MGYIKAKYCFLRDNDRLRTLAKIIITRRELTLKQISKDTGISERNLSGWTRGKRPYPTQVDVLALLDYLDIDVELHFKLNA